MATRFGRRLGLGGARAVAATVGAMVAAAAGLVAALGGQAGAAPSLRIVFGALALLVAVVLVGLTLAEQTAGGRARARRPKGWVDDHFAPRGRGVARKAEPGQHFVGRTRALQELVAWLTSDRSGMYVVTGNPGSGKSAVLGRVVALADRELRRELRGAGLPADTVLPEGSVDVAVWAKGLTMDDVTETIATAIGASASTTEDLIGVVLARGRPLVVVVDALDEAGSEREARQLAQWLLKPLAAAGRESGVKVLVGTRRGGGELLSALGPQKHVLDLDLPAYLERDDLVEYVRRRLLRDGEPGARTPYRGQPAVAAQVARAVADRASPSFLIAQLTSRSLTDADEIVDTTRGSWQTQFPADVGSAMDDYLDRFEQESDRRRARDLLSALAYAEGAGLPRDHADDLWPRLAGALGGRSYDANDVDWMLHTPAADLVDQSGEDGTLVCRLFHQALSDHLRGPSEIQRERQQALASALEASVPQRPDGAGRDWSRAGPYVRRHLAAHAAAGGDLDHLLEDPDFLIAADPPRLLRALPDAGGVDVADVRRAYQRVAHQLSDVAPAERAAYLHMAAQRIGSTTLAERVAQRHPDRPWTGTWAHWRVEAGHYIAGDHERPVVAIGELDDRPVIVSGGDDGTLRVWHLADGTALGEPFTGHTAAVSAIALGELDGRPVAVSGGEDSTLRVWDLATGAALGMPLTGHSGEVRAVAVAELDGRPAIVSGGEDATLRVWDLATGVQLSELHTGHTRPIDAVAVSELDGRVVAVSAAQDRTLRVWDLVTSAALCEPLTGHTGEPLVGAFWLFAVAMTIGELDDRPVIVSGGDDGTLRVWDVATGAVLGTPFTGHHGGVRAVAVAELDGRPVVVSGGLDRTVRLWDLVAGGQLGEPLAGHDGVVLAVAVGERDGRPVIVSGSGDSTLRVWDLAAGARLDKPLGHDGGALVVAVGDLDDRTVAVSGGYDGTLWVWDLATGEALSGPLIGHDGWVQAVVMGELDGRPVIVSGGADGTLRLWDLATGGQLGGSYSGHPTGFGAVAVGELDGRPVIVSVGYTGTLRVCDLASGDPIGEPIVHDWAAAVAMVELDGRPAIVSSAADDDTRVWDLATGTALQGHDGLVPPGDPLATVVVSGIADGTLRVRDLAGMELAAINLGSPVLATAVRGATIVVGLSAGVVAIDVAGAAHAAELRRRAAEAQRARTSVWRA